ncbi:penicillin-binding transpeptidase domain-containing protein [Nonomuraea sp. NBC_01738]|uniref:penicillin-binding transpeptidase domain-containing protein n=1 Tax=Nonomuraea sp. NBC_01738 TaxID=2976003 RepID=UPI002E12CC37|nr:penicillin-binding transpeptidase domain-containing protein [Nonomuraea sp. NBC_01738]
MSRARRTLAAAVTLTVASTTLTGCFEEPSAHDAVRDFLVGWQSEDYELAAARTDGDQATVRKALEAAKLDLDAASFRFRIKSLSREGDESTATFTAEVDLGENNPLWDYQSTIPLHLVDGLWKVRWSPSVLHPQLKDGQRFAVKSEPRPRQPVLDRAGDALQRPGRLYVAGVRPADLGAETASVVKQLAEITGFAEDRLLSRVRSSPPSDFVPLVTFGRDRFLQMKAKLEAIRPSIVIDAQDQPVDPAAPRDIVGKVGALTPQTEVKLGGPQRAGDSVGRSGLQKAYQDHLTGSTQTQVITLDLKSGAQAALLKEWPGRANRPVKTTIDTLVQNAAETAVAGGQASALVAVDAASGEIRAIGAKEMGQVKDALSGKFPAGTAFSIVAADALIKSNVRPSQRLQCPAERTVGGAKFVQTSQSAGATFQENFARGCVTALAALARRVKPEQLKQSAEAFGIGGAWKLPLKSFSGSMPSLVTDADKAKAIAGQTVEVSPLTMALVAAAVRSGTWHAPSLVTSPDAPDPSAEVEPAKPPEPVPLDPKVRTALTQMMRAGVASAPAAQAGAGKVYGVAATVPDGNQQLTWFVGWQGDVAVAVLAKNDDAAATAGRFFGALRSPQ